MRKSNLLIKSLSINTPIKAQNWRSQIKQAHLVSQISSILLQRRNWPSILQSLNLKSKLTPSLFLQILCTTKTHPQISLNFFKWAIKNAGFRPDLTVECRMTHLLIGSGLINPSKPILNSLLQNNPPAQVVRSLVKSCEKGEKDAMFSGSKCLIVLGCVVDWYCEKGLCLQALEVFNLSRDLANTKHSENNELFPIGSYNTLLNALQENNEAKLALCFYAVMLRHGVLIDRFTWRIFAKILIKEGKPDAIVRILDMEMHDSFIYDLAIECCSEKGMFVVALHLFDEMSKRKLNLGFNTLASILDGACRYKNDEVIKFAMESMAEKGYISKPLTEHDSLVRKLCNMRKAYAAYMFFKQACDAESSLENGTYGCMLRALSIEARVKDATELYDIIKHRGIQVNPVTYGEFANLLCDEDPSKELNTLLMDMISRGHQPSPFALSKYVASQCKKRRWKEAEELTELALQESISLEASCCSSLVEHYCKRGQIDMAINMHDRMERKEMTLDSRTYNALLCGLLGASRVKEAERIFEYMRIKNLLSSESFVTLINGFCRENEPKKAMKVHDQMLEMGLKPSPKTYKCLICNFR